MAVGSNWLGLNVFRVDATGNASYVFKPWEKGRAGHWRQARFKVTAEELARLRRVLQEIDYPSLKRGYSSKVMDGAQWYVRVRAGQATKDVGCSNYFPDEVVRLAQFIGQELLPAHGEQIRRAPRIKDEVAWREGERLQ
jgi:hypothetical protein